jgi:DNA-binding NtrC family response regulator
MKPRVLIVDDERNIRRTVSMILSGAGYAVREAESGEEALRLLDDAPADLVFLDVKLPGRSGIEILNEIAERHAATSVVMISGQASIAQAVEATRAGAFDFLEKPLSRERILIVARNAVRLTTLDGRVNELMDRAGRRREMVGESPPMRLLAQQIGKVGPAPATVLITGESGTGKELVARALHRASARRDGPFVKVNCAAIPEELIETELFGCLRGAYTGADRSRDGKFLVADGGTIFLDEVGDMSLRVQAKVLRALQEGEIERVGDSRVLRVDVRVIAATNKTLLDEVAARRFREDLYFRLNVVPIHVPPLRDRREDIPFLCDHFLRLYAQENDLPRKTLAAEAVRALGRMPWRGNVRELRNVIERLAILSDGPEISFADLASQDASVAAAPEGTAEGPAAPGTETASAAAAGEPARPARARDRAPALPLPGLDGIRALGGLVAARRLFERRCIEACLDRTGGNVSEAARWLGIERSNLHKKMQAYGLEARPPRAAGRPETEDPNHG